jgi:hypothetical protein
MILVATQSGMCRLMSSARSMNRVATRSSRARHARILRVQRDAVTAHPGTGVEGLEPERLGGRGVHDFPDVDVERLRDLGQFVHQRDVDGPVGVLQQLGEFRRPCGGDEVDRPDHAAVGSRSHFAGPSRDAAHDLGDVLGAEHVAGIDSLGGEADEDVLVDGEPGSLQDGDEDVLGGPG